jgi:hypothetical protein
MGAVWNQFCCRPCSEQLWLQRLGPVGRDWADHRFAKTILPIDPSSAFTSLMGVR